MSRVPAWDMYERLASDYLLILSILKFMVWFPFQDMKDATIDCLSFGVCMGVGVGGGLHMCERACISKCFHVNIRGGQRTTSGVIL